MPPNGDPDDESGRPTGTRSDDSAGNDDSAAEIVLRLFAGARQAAGTGRLEMRATDVQGVLERARSMFGEGFGEILERCRVWVNGEPAGPEFRLRPGDEVAVLPPVSGGDV